MDFETILSIVVIILSVVFSSKNKKTQKTGRRRNWQTNTTTALDPMKKQEDSARKGALGGSLEELFKELKTEFEKNYSGAKKSVVESEAQHNLPNASKVEVNPEEKVLYKPNTYASERSTFDDNTMDSKGTVYDKEIGGNETEFELNKKAILQGIIMSEVLQKPKSLRR